MKSISLFTGAGGLDLGLEAAGFKPAICVEIDDDARATLRFNREHWLQLETGDIHAHRPEEIIKQARLRPREATLLSGGPPCQPFSKAALWVNGKTAGLADGRSKTLNAYIGLVEAALPQVLLLENVKGLFTSGKNAALEMLEVEIDRINRRHRTRYRWTILQLNAADFGVPQFRERVYLVADRDGRILRPPCKTHSLAASDGSIDGYVTAWDAIGDLDTDTWDKTLKPRGKWAGLLPSIPEGWNYLYHTDRGPGMPIFGWRTRYWSFLLKLAKNKPSWTIPACPGPATGPFHWRNRLLSVRELCRLQTFLDNYIIQGTHASAQRQIGNAVPPLIGEIIGKEICHQWLSVRTEGKLRYLPLYRQDRAKPHPIYSVPGKYSSLIGNHKPHPGVGKGPRAMVRKGR